MRVILSAAKDPRPKRRSREADPSSFLLRMTTHVYRDYSYDALDANALNGYDTYNLGQYSFPPQTVSWNVVGLPKPGTISADVVRVLFNFHHYDAPTVLNVTV